MIKLALVNGTVEDIAADTTLAESKLKIDGNFEDLLANDSAIDTRTTNLEAVVVTSTPKVKFTAEGGLAVKLTNKTGSASVKGTVVRASTSTDNAFGLSGVSGDEAIGVVYESSIADASECWVVVSGIAEVLLKDGTACTHGDWAGVSDTSGRAYAATEPASSTGHDVEIGHFIESKGSGTNVLAKLVLHFR